MQPEDIIVTSVNVGSRAQLDIGNKDIGNKNVGNKDIGNKNIGNKNVGNKNVGNKNAGRKQITTGIFKEPVTDPVYVSQDGLDNDFIGDLSRHGGPDQAVYLYSAVEAAWWSETLKRPLTPGFFGENITLNRWWPDVRIGDRLQIGQLVLEISAPRIPCHKLAARVGQSHFVKTFVAAKRPGFYARVLGPGIVCAGDVATVCLAAANYPKAIDIFTAWHNKNRDGVLLRQGLASPLAERARVAFAYWLEQEAG